MLFPSRTRLVKASGLTSSYKKKYKPKERWDVEVFNEGAYIVPEMFTALLELNRKVKRAGGSFYITELYRSWDVQQEARDKYLSKRKKDYVAPPGSSFHNAGRAVDISVKELNFKNKDREDWLLFFWGLAVSCGFSPIIAIPDIDASEAWHFDFLGCWEGAREAVGYSEVAKCACLDIGAWDPKQKKSVVENMFIQAQLIRLGEYAIGKVDGIIGPKTKEALARLNLGRCSKKDMILMLTSA